MLYLLSIASPFACNALTAAGALFFLVAKHLTKALMREEEDRSMFQIDYFCQVNAIGRSFHERR